MRISALHPRFGARVEDIDLDRDLDPDEVVEIRATFDQHSLLVFPGQKLSPARQVQFSSYFGPLERAITRMSDDEVGSQIARLSNMRPDGSLVSADDRQALFDKANHMWHTDSTYKPQTALASLLYAIEVPSVGGDTEYASTRAAYEDLSQEMRARVDHAFATHSLAYSRAKVAEGLLSPELEKQLPPIERPLVREIPSTGARAIYVASHAFEVRGMEDDEALALIQSLLDWCTSEQFIYRHHWQAGDLVMWDNRATLHRATPYDLSNERRLMHRSTVIDAEYEASLSPG